MKVDLRIPDYSTLSRRMRKSKIKFEVSKVTLGSHIIIDGTGLSVYGAAEWHESENGLTKFRGYRKLNIAINEHQQIVACELTNKHGDDKAQVPKLLRRIHHYYDKVIADGNYDDRKVYAAIKKYRNYKYVKNKKCWDVNIVIPPRCDTRVRVREKLYPIERSDHIKMIREHGRINWQNATGYGERSLVEVAMYRYKKIIGQFMKSINFANQKVEAVLACNILNTMATLGMPETVRIN